MKRHEEPYLPVHNPLPDAIPCTLLDASDKRAVIDDAVEHLPACLSGRAWMRLCAVLRMWALATGAHLAG